MKKAVLLLILFLSIGISLFSQNMPSIAPLNPDFVRFMELQKSGKVPLTGTDEFGPGAGPPPGVVIFDNYLKNNRLKSTSFDPVYDLRTLGLVTPVKGQTNGACWAYASIASVESQWLKLGLGTWDLSDNNLKYCHGFDPSRSTWGNHFMATAYFARRSGPLVEADDPNSTGSSCPTDKIPVGYITEARYLPHDMNTIKQAIMDQGAIYTMMFYSATYYNATTYTYFYNGIKQVNHAVDLVGWDDNKITASSNKGAWICKNSYGPDWGESGYFYVSYDDNGILDYNAYWPVREENVPNTEIYGYDKLGDIGETGYNKTVGYMLVKFVATGKQILSKVGTYATASGETIDIDIFDNFDIATNTLFGSLANYQGLSCQFPGYYTADLPQPAVIEPGNDFYVRIRYTTPGIALQIPIEYQDATYSYPDIEQDVAWMSSDPSIYKWYLIGNSTAFKWDPCVKVYAASYPETWNGSTSTDWNTALNWTPTGIPNASSDVVIPNVFTKPIIVQEMTSPALCNNLTIETGSSLTVNAGKALTVYGSLTNNAGNNGLIIGSGASVITKGSVTGTATINSSITGANWHFISSPVSNATALTFTTKYLQKHTEQTNAYTDITSAADPLVPMKGYALWGDNSGFTAQYKGILNTGIQAVSLSRSAAGLNSGWNLVGNPYPSSIDWDASGWTKTNMNNAIYIEKNGQFATYINGVGALGGTKYIAPGQGFFVSASGIGSGNLAMNNFVRSHNATPFFKNSFDGEDSLVRLEVSGNGYTDEAVVRFMPEATAEFDREYDAFKLFGYIDESAQIYTLGSVPLTINTVPHGTYNIPLGIHANTSGKYTLAATHTGSLADVTLEDIKTGITTKLTESSYTFDFETGENEERFMLHFNSLSLTKIADRESSYVSVYSFNQNVHINLKDQVKADISIYTIAGQLVANRHSAKGKTTISLPGTGIFIVRVITPEETLVNKVWVH